MCETFLKSINNYENIQVEIVDKKLFLKFSKNNLYETDIILNSEFTYVTEISSWIFIVCNEEILVIDKLDYKLLDTIKTFPLICKDSLKKGFSDSFSATVLDEKLILAYLHPEKGHLGIIYYDELTKRNIEKKLNCHYSEISRLAINGTGTFAATCSKDGKFLKIFDLTTEKLHIQFNRGKISTSEIYSLCFNPSSSLIATSSSSGYVKIFNTNITEDNTPKNKVDWVMSLISMKQAGKRIFKFFVSKEETKCSFEAENILKVYSKEGDYFRVTLDFQTGNFEINNTKIDLSKLDGI